MQGWLDKINEQMERKADTAAMHATVDAASTRAQECLESAADALETAVNCASSALQKELQSSTAELVNGQAALAKRVNSIENEVAKVPTCAQVRTCTCLLYTSPSPRD